MTSDTLTDLQRAARDVRAASVALSAGAGCGKTTVLTARFLAALDRDDARSLQEVVALTFTEKAARELRGRVRVECRKKLEQGEDKDRWRTVLRGLEAARIGTFHGFCADILRRYPIEAGVEPGFGILEESVAPTLRDEALGGCLRRWLATRNDDLFGLAVEFGVYAVRQALADLIDDPARDELRKWSERSPDEIVAGWRSAWRAEGLTLVFGALFEAAESCRTVLASNECTHPVGRERRAFLLDRLDHLDPGDDPAGLLAEIKEKARVQGGGTKNHWASESIYRQVKAHLEGLREAIDDARTRMTWDEAATRAAAVQGLRVARLAVEAMDAHGRAKREAGMLDFDDLMIKTRNLLRDRGPAILDPARIMILVDEFQDTDPIQSEILALLAGEDRTSGRLFLVGDYKQSIYRFRGAQPGIFQDYRVQFPGSGRLDLNENFRSVPGIIDFVNALFAETFTETGDRLFPARPPISGADRPAVEFLWADESGGAKVSAPERRKVEARWIARVLARRIAEGWLIRDKTTKEERQATPGDVAILFRSLNDAAPYESALVAEGLDYHIVGGSAFFGQQEVIDLINLCSAIEDPLDAVALAGTLRSPFFCVSDDGLFWLATSRDGDLPHGFESWRRIGDLATTDRRRVARAHELLRSWRAAKDHVPIAALIDRALDESGYEAALLAEPLGARKRANVRKLVRLARRFDLQGRLTLADFVARLRRDLRRPPREEQANTSDEQGASVRLMTIHQAKGLEFPIVVVPDLDRKPMGERGGVAFDPKLGPLVRPSGADDAGEDDEGRSLGWTIYRERERREDADESLRLFYVATTRAQDALILSAGLAATGPPSSPALKLLDRRFDRAEGACRGPLPEGWAAPRVGVIDRPPGPVEGRPGPTRLRADPLSIADAIDSVPLQPGGEGRRTWSGTPRRFDLDPAATLSPIAARIDRLIRAILADPKALDPRSLDSVALRAARLQDPSAPPSIQAKALGRLKPWLAGPLGRELARATEIVRAVPWSIAWPRGAKDPTVFLGRLDFAYRDRDGHWRSIALSDPTAPEPRERLRLLLAAEATADLGVGPIVQGWRVRLGDDGGLHGEERFDAAGIEEAVARLLKDGK